jgi:four helix bundle protein
MARPIPHPGPAGDPAPHLDCERLDCYRLAVEFQTIAARLVATRRVGALRDQLDRASVSIVLNLAEGAGRRFAREKAHFYSIARGSATECAAVLDLLSARGLLSAAEHRHGRGLVVRMVQMLTRLIGFHASGARGRQGTEHLVP